MTFSIPLTDSPLVISRCVANSHPLSMVIVLSVFLYGNSSLTTARAVDIAFLPWDNFYMSMKWGERSVMVRIACPYVSTMVSISQSPKRFPPACADLSCIPVCQAMRIPSSCGTPAICPGDQSSATDHQPDVPP